MEKRKAEKEARPYQIELLNKALQQNSIVYLGTGAGKTFIATMMIKEKMSAILHDNKKTVFLAHRVCLVTQPAKFINSNGASKPSYNLQSNYDDLGFALMEKGHFQCLACSMTYVSKIFYSTKVKTYLMLKMISKV